MLYLGIIGYNNFGSKMEIINEYKKYNEKLKRNYTYVDVYFHDYDWTFYGATYNNFKKGKIACPYEPRYFGKGFIGEGKYKIIENGKQTKYYIHWKGILERCYDEKRKSKYPRYKDSTMDESWHNFQIFCEWLDNNYYEVDGQKMCVDKDILVKNNKIYSPQTCLIVPNNINVLFTKSNKTRGKCLLGVDFHKKSRKYRARCSVETDNGYKNITLGFYETELEAFNVYKNFKEKHIKEIAEKYKLFIPKELYDALYNYKVDITD